MFYQSIIQVLFFKSCRSYILRSCCESCLKLVCHSLVLSTTRGSQTNPKDGVQIFPEANSASYTSCAAGVPSASYIFLTIGLQKSHNDSFVWPFTQSPQAQHKDTVQIFSCKLKHVRRVLQSSRGCCRASEIPSLSFVYL